MNHFTSYEVSKAIAEAGIKSQTKALYAISATDPSQGHWSGHNETIRFDEDGYMARNEFTYIPAYTAGELLRTKELKFCLENGLAYREPNYMVDYWDSNGKCIGIAPTPEDALGLALIEIRRGESK